MQAEPEIISAIPDIRDRIAFLVRAKHKNANSFGLATGISRQLIYDIVGRKRNMPSYQTLTEIISAIPDINLEWLMLGTGAPFLPSATRTATSPTATTALDDPTVASGTEKYYVAETPTALTKDLKAHLKAPVKAHLKAHPNSGALDWEANGIYLPDARAAAGAGAFVEAYQEEVPIRIPWLSGRGYVCINVTGDSMYPTLSDKDILVMQPLTSALDIQTGYIHTILQADTGYVKRVFRLSSDDSMLELRPDNPQYPVERIHLSSVSQVFRVVAHFSQSLAIRPSSDYVVSQKVLSRLDALEKAVFALNPPS